MAQFLVDTNVWLRIATPDSMQHNSAKSAIARLLGRRDEIHIAPQVIAEFWVVATRPTNVNGLGWSFDAAALEVSRLLDRFPLLSETPQLFWEWHRVIVGHRVIGKQAHDARLAALMNLAGLSHLLTFTVNNFRAYDLSVVSPDDLDAS